MFLLKPSGFAINTVIHHDDVSLTVIVRTRSSVARGDSHSSDPSVITFDSEKRQISVAGRGGNITAKQQLAVHAKKFHQRAGPAVAVFLAGATSIRLIDVSEHCAKATYCCWNISVRGG